MTIRSLSSTVCALALAAAPSIALASPGDLIHRVARYDEDYVRVPKTDPLYSPIGIVRGGGWEGTAFLISDCHILTAAHVIMDADGAFFDDTYEFIIGASDTADFHEGAIATPVVTGDFATGRTCEDFAVLELNRCLGEQYGFVYVAPFTLEQLAELQRLGRVVGDAGYPFDQSVSAISTDQSCVVDGPHVSDPDALAHTCNSVEGMSGGPLFFQLPSRERLVAFAIQTDVITIPGYIANYDLLTGEDAAEASLRNKAAPAICFWDRIAPFTTPLD